jgi:Uma2 family endonuclease
MMTILAVPATLLENGVGLAPASNGMCLRIPPSATKLDGFRRWVKSRDFPDKVRVTFLNGEICLDMSKEEIQTHALVKAEIGRGVMNLNRGTRLGQFYPDGVLITNEDAGVSNNPDGAFVTWETFEKGLVRLVPHEGRRGRFLEIEGIPDWILEIVSQSSVRKDTKDLRLAYHRARIPEYWLIDARGENISFQILQWRKSGYVSVGNRDGWQRSRVFERSFRLSRSVARMGLWEYTLEMRK